jgi:hypothetical protein
LTRSSLSTLVASVTATWWLDDLSVGPIMERGPASARKALLLERHGDAGVGLLLPGRRCFSSDTAMRGYVRCKVADLDGYLVRGVLGSRFGVPATALRAETNQRASRTMSSYPLPARCAMTTRAHSSVVELVESTTRSYTTPSWTCSACSRAIPTIGSGRSRSRAAATSGSQRTPTHSRARPDRALPGALGMLGPRGIPRQ